MDVALTPTDQLAQHRREIAAACGRMVFLARRAIAIAAPFDEAAAFHRDVLDRTPLADGVHLYATAATDPDLLVARIPESERR